MALLAGALQFVDVPNYHALLLRRTYSDLALPECLMDLSHTWLDNTEAHWNDKRKTWTFPEGGSLTFGYCAHTGDEERYESAQFQYIGIDEVTEFAFSQYDFLLTRLRRRADCPVPIRMRVATNPGGPGHEWVKKRFLIERTPDRLFLPATLNDNPHLDREAYEMNLQRRHPVIRAQLLYGDWDADYSGQVFNRGWLGWEYQAPLLMRQVRYWDLAATKDGGDWTVGAKLGEKSGIYGILDIIRVRETSGNVEALVKQTAQMDGPGVAICMEQEGGASGKSIIEHYARSVLRGYNFKGIRATGSKLSRAIPVASAMERGFVKVMALPGTRWVEPLLDELVAFPAGQHDDQVDAVAGAFNILSRGAGGTVMTAEDSVAGMRRLPSFGTDFEEGEIPGL